MPNQGERRDPTGQRKGNLNLLYTITHTFKHGIWGTEGWNPDTDENKRRDMQIEAMSALWTLRSNPSYFAYPDSEEYRLGDLLGDLPADGKAVQELARVGAKQEALYSYARLSQQPDYEGVPGQAVRIPEHNDRVQKGLLIDVVVATGRRIQSEAMSDPYYQKVIAAQAERAGVSPEDYQKYVLAWVNYNLYTIGYLLPKIEAGTRAEEILKEQKLAEDTILTPKAITKKYGVRV